MHKRETPSKTDHCEFLMAKDKSEKKKGHVSDAVPAEAEEDVEMKVSSNYACLEE